MRTNTNTAATVAKPAAKRTPKAKPAAVVAPVQPEAAKPAKPADTSRADALAARISLIGAARTIAATIYNGDSLAVRSSTRTVASGVYAELLANPKHRTSLAKLTPRDESALHAIVKHSDAAGTFDPPAFNLDRGNFSRLASVGFIAATDAGRFTLTPAGADYAKLLAKRLAA